MLLNQNYLLSQNNSKIITAFCYVFILLPILIIIIIAAYNIINMPPGVKYESPFGPFLSCNSPVKGYIGELNNTPEKIGICPTICQDILDITRDEWKYFRNWFRQFYKCETEKEKKKKVCTNLFNLLNEKKQTATSKINSNTNLTTAQKNYLISVVNSTYDYLSASEQNRFNAFRFYSLPNNSPLCNVEENYCVDFTDGTRYKYIVGNKQPTWSEFYNGQKTNGQKTNNLVFNYEFWPPG